MFKLTKEEEKLQPEFKLCPTSWCVHPDTVGHFCTICNSFFSRTNDRTERARTCFVCGVTCCPRSAGYACSCLDFYFEACGVTCGRKYCCRKLVQRTYSHMEQCELSVLEDGDIKNVHSGYRSSQTDPGNCYKCGAAYNSDLWAKTFCQGPRQTVVKLYHSILSDNQVLVEKRYAEIDGKENVKIAAKKNVPDWCLLATRSTRCCSLSGQPTTPHDSKLHTEEVWSKARLAGVAFRNSKRKSECL